MFIEYLLVPDLFTFIENKFKKKLHFALIMIKSQNTNLETCAIFAYG